MNPYSRMMAVYEREFAPYLTNIDLLFELQENTYLLAERLNQSLAVLESRSEIEAAASAEG